MPISLWTDHRVECDPRLDGDSRLERGEVDAAIESYGRALAARPTDTWVLRSRAIARRD